MIENNYNDELIEQYLLGELSGDLLDEFKERLAIDKEFRKEVALQKAILRNIKETGRKEWAMKLETIHKDMQLSKVSKGPEERIEKQRAPVRSFYRYKYYLVVAASVILIIFSTLLFVKMNKTSDPQVVFLAYYQPYPNLEPGTRSLPTDRYSEKKAALKAYDKGDYLQSISLFTNILKNGEDEMVLFYLGNSYLSAGKAAEAETVFKQYLSKYKEFRMESNWYLGLSYLKQGKTKEARTSLEELAKENNDYGKKARELLSKL